jgi:hypothetical protein
VLRIVIGVVIYEVVDWKPQEDAKELGREKQAVEESGK